jgi:DNA polymerase III subunit delta
MTAVTEHVFGKTIAAGTFEPVYYLYGDDDFRKEEAVARALGAAVAPEGREFNTEIRRATDLDAATLESVLGTPSMMADRRAVVLRDVGALRKEARRALDRYLEEPAPDTLLLMVAAAGGKPDRALSERAVAVEFPLLAGDRLPKWITHRARELGATITPEAANMLQAATGPDLASVASELDKLASYARGAAAQQEAGGADAGTDTTIDEEAVTAVVGVRRGETMSDLLDRVGARDAAGALALVEHVLSQPKTTAVSVVMALSVQTLALAWGRARLDEGTSAGRLTGEYFTLLKETGAYPMRPWGEAVAAWIKVLDRWSAPALDAALDALLAADVALKDTRVSSDEQIIASLVLSMCAQGTRRPARTSPSGAGRARRGGATRAAMMVTLMVATLMVGAAVASAQGGDTTRSGTPRPIDSAMTAAPDTGSAMSPADTALQRAQALVAQGRTDAGRALVDSVLKMTPSGTMSYASALYARASLATNADSAEQDYRRLMVEYSSSPRASDALLRLAQLELARGDRAQAADHLARLTREQAPGQTGIVYARTELQVALAYFDLQDAAHACAALVTARSAAPATDVELRNRIDYNTQRCPRAALVAAPPAAAAGAATPPANGAPASTPAASTTAATPPPAGGPPASAPGAGSDSGRAATGPSVASRGDTGGRAVAPSTLGPPAHAADTGAAVHHARATPAAAKPPTPVATKPTTPAPKPSPRAAPAAGVAPAFTVQVAAYDTRALADSLSEKLKARGYPARVSGIAKPFRVRIGRFSTEAQADAELRALKAKGLAGFVTAAE